jgi:hypothetical protein
MKNIIFATAFLLLCSSLKAQSVQVKDLLSSVGKWEGKLSYLDYSSGNAFSMLANLSIELTADKKGFVIAYEYPKEPHANSKDTTFIVGNYFGKDNILDFKKDSRGNYTMITDVNGNDGNDNKRAVLRHTYRLQSNRFSMIKEVKFEGTDTWIKRNEYLLNKVGN